VPLVTDFEVRLAHDGTGKTKEGDGRIPLGSYPLGAPRPSKRYGTFIPIGYPTPAQRAKGYTGGSLGVHGPDRRVKWLGRLVNTFDTTDGCVGLAKDDEMDVIASWIRRRHAGTILLVAP
jgi:murein L,D-transpeptidase YafK